MSLPIFRSFILLMIIIGLLTAWLRHNETGIPILPGEQTATWIVEARIDFVPSGKVLLSLNIPDQPPGFHVFSEQTASPGYGFAIVEHDGSRRGEWSIRHADGQQTLYYKVQVIPDQDVTDRGVPPSTIRKIFWGEPEATAAEQLLAGARARSSTPESLAREVIRELTAAEPSQNAALLLANRQLVPLIERLLTDAGLAARISMGLLLQDARRNQSLTPVIEVFAADRWVTFDPQTGRQGLPDNMLLWHRGGRSLVDLIGGSNSKVSFSMIRQAIPAMELVHAQDSGGGLGLFSVHRLPIEEQSVFKLLLLLPVAALVTVFMRILIGLRTSGTFMPILIALAFLETSLVPGLVNFVAIVGLGLLLRSYLSHLNLLLVARIATIIVIVVFLMGMMSLIGYQLGFSSGMAVAFFPIIIIAWTIERMSILWEEEGPREVFVQGLGSLLVAIAAYLVMQHPVVGHLSFNFPELNLVVIALIMLMGRYTGYRLLEIHRFRAMEERT